MINIEFCFLASLIIFFLVNLATMGEYLVIILVLTVMSIVLTTGLIIRREVARIPVHFDKPPSERDRK
jgi:hypothetical protein